MLTIPMRLLWLKKVRFLWELTISLIAQAVDVLAVWRKSDGCITLPNPEIFNRLRVWLKQQKTGKIPGTQTNYYGKVIVR